MWSATVCYSFTMGCPPVRGDNPQALASGLSYVQVDKHGITIYTTYISVDLAHHEIFHAKDGKGGIKGLFFLLKTYLTLEPICTMAHIFAYSA